MEKEEKEEKNDKNKSEKEVAVEELEKMGYPSVFEHGLPMFRIKDQKEAEIIREKLIGKGSFGFRYVKNQKGSA